MKRHPAAIARDEWDSSDEGQRCHDAYTLGQYPQQYLTNRLHSAFQAGYDAALRRLQEAYEDEGRTTTER